MASHHSCRGCRHGQSPQNGGLGWCRLRQLPIHPELVGELSCYHWTAREPRLPTLNSAQIASVSAPVSPAAPPPLAGPGSRQLSLEGALRRRA
ncbi:MAG: hypothetical protein ACKOCI_07030 [Cyanobium sp.]